MSEMEYISGSILRIKLRNFLTYAFTEFFPGPNMNMVIGPNGTGKSTIVCAIALGLGGKPDVVLGRAKELQDFIKNGEDIARIEIELKNEDGPNVVIRRSFKKSSSGSEWKLNGQKSNEVAVKKAVASFNIQVDNLCQFLPQDRVSQFAHMDAQKLLRETERAAGPDLIKQHDELIAQNNELENLTSKLATKQDDLKNLRARNDRIAGAVERMQEKESIESELDDVKIKLVIAEYAESVESYQTAKAEAENCAKEVEAVRNSLKEYQVNVTAATKVLVEATKKTKDSDLKFKEVAATMAEIFDKSGDLESKAKEYEAKILSVMRLENARTRRIEDCRINLETGKKTLESKALQLIDKGVMNSNKEIPRTIPILDELRLKAEECDTKGLLLNQEFSSLKAEGLNLSREKKAAEVRRDRKLEELQNLDNIRSKRLHKFKTDRDPTYDAVMWLRENRTLFRHRVFEPVILEIEIVDTKYAAMIESVIPWKVQRAFVFEDPNDFKIFRQRVIGDQKMRVNMLCGEKPLEYYQNEAANSKIRERFQALNFDGSLLDLIKADPIILAVLCSDPGLDRMPYSVGGIPSADMARTEKLVPKFVNQNFLHVTKGAYGSYSTRLQQLRNPNYLIDSIDPGVKDSLEKEVETLQAVFQNLDVKFSELNDRAKNYQNTIEKLSREKAEYKQERDLLQKMIADYKIFAQKIGSHLFIIDTLEDKFRVARTTKSAEEEVKLIRSKIIQIQRERVKFSTLVYDTTAKSNSIFKNRVLAMMKKLDIEARKDAADKLLADNSEGLRDLEMQLADKKSVYKRFKEKAKLAHKFYTEEKNRIADIPSKLAFFQEVRVFFIQDLLETQIQLEECAAGLHARLDMIDNIDPNVVQEYTQRRAEIDALEKVVGNQDLERLELAQRIQSTHEVWKSALCHITEVISINFSESFASIGCSGEVRLKEDTDYNKWGVEILVKFRAAEQLQVLTGHRQSGGERSVSTMLYLIALQSLSKSPFRVVDEINQGMDPRNERLVHKLIVNAACIGSTSQYFLITPKLLPDLVYHEKMRVLCIFNGFWQPESWDLLAGTEELQPEAGKRAKIDVIAH